MAKEQAMLQLERQMKKGFLGAAYNALDDTETKQKVVTRYGLLIEENPQKSKEATKNLTLAVLPAIAFRQVALESGQDRRANYKAIRESVLASAESSKSLYQKLGKLPFFWGLFRRLCKLSMPESLAQSNWHFEWVENNEKIIHWNCVQCIYKDTFEKYDFPELTPIFCERDDVIYSEIPGVIWARTMTMGRGGEHCDFCLKRQ